MHLVSFPDKFLVNKKLNIITTSIAHDKSCSYIYLKATYAAPNAVPAMPETRPKLRRCNDLYLKKQHCDECARLFIGIN